MGKRAPREAKSPIAEHIRRPHPFPVKDHWRMDCACGWRGEVSRWVGKSRIEAERDLNKLFVEHVPDNRRQRYVLVDQRLHSTDENDAGDVVELATGNFIMPEGKPCTVLGWWETDGEYHCRAKGFALNDPVLELPVGEIRTADGRVFRMA